MKISVFKFGGASLNSVQGIRNVAGIIGRHSDGPLLVVVSAMGKTTNALEQVLKHHLSRDPLAMIEAWQKTADFHLAILQGLFPDQSHKVYGEVGSLLDQLRGYLRKGHLYQSAPAPYDYEYDQIVSFGELLASCIVSNYLMDCPIPCLELDARGLIHTDDHYREARVKWDITGDAIRKAIVPQQNTNPSAVWITQGFIGSSPDGHTTTLGREGSDFSAAIFAWSLKVSEVTIWKDVPGVLNADPAWFRGARKIDTLSYREAIELAYYGASVIHPRTIKPLENAGIRLHVKSFKQPGLPGTIVEKTDQWSISFPIYIRKTQQVLISISPRDFSFILEENMGRIFSILAKYRARVHVMQNSAISFSVCTDRNEYTLDPLISELSSEFEIRYNPGVELYTIRHYTPAAIRRVMKNKVLLLEQKTRSTVHLVVA